MRSFLLCATLAGVATGFLAPSSTSTKRPAFLKNQDTATTLSSSVSDLVNGAANGATEEDYELLSLPARPGRPLKVAIAGGGVGGLTAALCMLKKGFDVTVYEKTAAFARFGGPIQFASNALSVLKEIDNELFDRVMEKFTFTGTRACGIKDGKKKDTEMEAMEMGGRQWD